MDAQASPRPRRRVWLWSAAGVLVAGGLIAGVLLARRADGGKEKNGKDDPPAAPVELSPVVRGAIATHLQTTATLEARNSAVLVARGQGEVVAVLAEEGQWVERGAVLARLDDTEARLALERAEVAAEVAQREAERGHQLAERGYLSGKELDDLDLRQRSAAVERAQRRHDVSQMRIVAPFSGHVTQRMIQLGETVLPGRECFRLVDMEPLLARVYFPERELPNVRVGLPATVEVDAHPGRAFAARVSIVSPVVDRANGTFKVTLEVRDPANLLRPGGFARVWIRTGVHEGTVLMPRRAALNEDGVDFVFVARGDSVTRVPVRLGAISGDTAQILAGLSPGESVVTIGQGGLKQGSRIKPVRF